MDNKKLRYFIFFYSIRNNTYVAVGNLHLRGFDHFPNNKRICEEMAKDQTKFSEKDVVITGWEEMTEEDFDSFTGENSGI